MEKSKKYNILYVDNEPSNLKVLKNIFASDFNVYSAESVAAGLLIYEKEDIHFIIVDQGILELSGTDFLKKISTQNVDIKIILLRKNGVAKALETALNEAGIWRHIKKPYDAEGLRALILHGVEIYTLLREKKEIERNLRKSEKLLRATQEIIKTTDNFSIKKTGDNYFKSVVNGLSRALNADYAFIAKTSKETKTAIIQYLSAKGKIVDNMPYDLENSPYSSASNGMFAFYPERVQELFPNDLLLKEMGAQAYVGIPIHIRNGEEEGDYILVALFTKTIENKGFYEHILRLSAQKIQAEIERNNFLEIVKESKKEYQDLFDNINDGIRILNAEGFVIQQNKACNKIFGYSLEEWKDIPVFDVVYPEDKAVAEAKFAELQEKGSYKGYEHRVIRKNKSTVWVQVSSIAIYNEEGAFIGSRDVVRNITQQKVTEKELKKSEIKYKDLFDNISDGMCILNTKGDVLYHNPAFSKVLGYEEEDWERIRMPDIVHPDHYEASKAQYAKLKEQGSYQGYETQIISKDKSIVWIQVNSTAIFNDNGDFIGSNDIIRDITEQKKAEIERNIIQEMLQKTSQVAKIGGWEIDLLEGTLLWSDVTKQIHDVSEDYEPTLEAAMNFYKEGHSRNTITEKINRAIEKGESFDVELEMATVGNRQSWVRSIGHAGFREGKVIRLYGTFQDITKQKQLEDELEKANDAEFAKLYHQQKIYSNEIEVKSRELDRFFELSLDIICIVNREGVIQRLNPAFINTLGYDEASMLSQSLFNFLHPADLEETTLQFEKTVTGDDMVAFVNRYRMSNGEYCWLSWHTILDPNSRLIYAIARDISEERKANKEIEDLKNTLDQTAIIIIINDEGKIISVNDKFCEASGYTREDVIGESHKILMSDYHSEKYWATLMDTVSVGTIWRGEMKNKSKQGTSYWADTSIVPFCDNDGQPFQYIAIQSDITSRKKLEKDLRQAEESALKSAEVKENFLANMSHEIRTPMNAVLGFSRLLLQTDMEKTQYDYAQAIYGSAENLLVIVNDILDFSKIESGKFKLEKIEFNLVKKIKGVLNILKTSIEHKQLDMIVDIDPNLPVHVVAAADRITQVLINLIGNALKFTKEGFIKLRVTTQAENVLLFEVEDTGIGIHEDKLEYIFESFTQAENYTTRMYGGTGLGLSISKKLVALMGGNIYVKSELGKGSSFSFTVPFENGKAKSKEASENNEQIKEMRMDGVKLLVVDDNRLNQELMTIYLNMLNCSYDLAYNGQEAVELALAREYDLIFMDIQMPIMDGLAATTLIRKEDPTTPIIAMTAHTLKKEKQKCFDIGMNDYLGKPFKKEELQEILIKHLVEKVNLIPVQQPTEEKEIKAPNASKIDLNTEQLSYEVGGDEEMVKHVLLLFKDEVKQVYESIQTAIENKDIETIGKVTHRVKPNFALLNLGFLVEIILEIEKLVAANAKEELIYKHCQDLLKYIPIVQLQLAEELV